MNASKRTSSRDTKRFFMCFLPPLDNGDGEHDVERVHVLAVGRVCAYLGEVFKRHVTLWLDDREARAVDGERSRAGGGTAVYLERHTVHAAEAVVVADLVRAVSYLDTGDAHRTVGGVVRDLRVVRSDHGAVYDVYGQRGGDSDVDRAVLVVHGERDRHRRRGARVRKRAEREAECEGESQRAYAFSFQVLTSLLRVWGGLSRPGLVCITQSRRPTQ